MTKERRCEECRHIEGKLGNYWPFPTCGCPMANYSDVVHERRGEGRCGPTGKLWEPRNA